VRGEKVMSRRRLEQELDLSDVVLARIVARLKEQDLIIEVEGDLAGLVPARPPSEITLAQVMRAFRGLFIMSTSRCVCKMKC
jgi:DNA-binding IscR family transcriptional regulator